MGQISNAGHFLFDFQFFRIQWRVNVFQIVGLPRKFANYRKIQNCFQYFRCHQGD